MSLTPPIATDAVKLDLFEVFSSSPVIYTILALLSISSLALWLYSLLTLKLAYLMPNELTTTVRNHLAEKQFEAALVSCQKDRSICSSIIASGISARKHGAKVMMDAMQSEGKRVGNRLWQRVSVLSEIATIAPMLGLLGTVLGLFFAFYDVNRTPESINTIFDGLGIAVGTTVAGLVVAILSSVFYTTLKFRLVSLLNTLENEVIDLVNMIETSRESGLDTELHTPYEQASK